MPFHVPKQFWESKAGNFSQSAYSRPLAHCVRRIRLDLFCN
uniref:Uncharacterized protein n=1 Tax=Anguilla anguilla TaxID=7936 RepID=A0A0E9U932_ANGAN